MMINLWNQNTTFFLLWYVLDVPLVHLEGGGYRPGALSGRTSWAAGFSRCEAGYVVGAECTETVQLRGGRVAPETS